MNNDRIPCCAADALRRIRQVRINGIMTGITMPDESIATVQELNLSGETAIREALMKKVRIYNYIPPGIEEEYAKAMMAEYRTAEIKKKPEGL